jgi:hypothetical protein
LCRRRESARSDEKQIESQREHHETFLCENVVDLGGLRKSDDVGNFSVAVGNRVLLVQLSESRHSNRFTENAIARREKNELQLSKMKFIDRKYQVVDRDKHILKSRS